MTDLAKLLEVLRIVDEMDTYIKVIAVDNKISKHEAQELLYYIQKANNVL